MAATTTTAVTSRDAVVDELCCSMSSLLLKHDVDVAADDATMTDRDRVTPRRTSSRP
jgi:hypothetical protein